MAQGMSMSWVVIAVMSIMLVQGVMSKKLIVGDGSWTIPSSPDFYATWASKQTFAVDDILVFTIVGGHTVAEVSKDDYEACKLPTTSSSKTTEMPLTKEGSYYFICTVPGHCSNGQKLAVTVPSTATDTTPATPTPNTPSSPDAPPKSPSPGNASPLGISAFPVSFVAIVISFVVLAKVIT